MIYPKPYSIYLRRTIGGYLTLGGPSSRRAYFVLGVVGLIVSQKSLYEGSTRPIQQYLFLLQCFGFLGLEFRVVEFHLWWMEVILHQCEQQYAPIPSRTCMLGDFFHPELTLGDVSEC